MDSAKLKLSGQMPEYHLMVQCFNPFEVSAPVEIPVDITEAIKNQQLVYAARCMGKLMLQDAENDTHLKTENFFYFQFGYGLCSVRTANQAQTITSMHERLLKMSERGRQWLNYLRRHNGQKYLVEPFSKNNHGA